MDPGNSGGAVRGHQRQRLLPSSSPGRPGIEHAVLHPQRVRHPHAPGPRPEGRPRAKRWPAAAAVRQPLIVIHRRPAQAAAAGRRPRSGPGQAGRGKGEKPVRPGGDREPQPKDGDGPKVVGHASAYDPAKRPATRRELHRPGRAQPPAAVGQPGLLVPAALLRQGRDGAVGRGDRPGDGPLPGGRQAGPPGDQAQAGANPEDVRQLELDSRQVFGYKVEGLGRAGSDTGVSPTLTERTTLVEKSNGDARMRSSCVEACG